MADAYYDATYERFTDENGDEWFLLGLLDPDDHTFDGEDNYVDDQGRTWLRSNDELVTFDDDDLAAFGTLTIDEGEDDEDGEDGEEVEDRLSRR